MLEQKKIDDPWLRGGLLYQINPGFFGEPQPGLTGGCLIFKNRRVGRVLAKNLQSPVRMMNSDVILALVQQLTHSI